MRSIAGVEGRPQVFGISLKMVVTDCREAKGRGNSKEHLLQGRRGTRDDGDVMFLRTRRPSVNLFGVLKRAAQVLGSVAEDRRRGGANGGACRMGLEASSVEGLV